MLFRISITGKGIERDCYPLKNGFFCAEKRLPAIGQNPSFVAEGFATLANFDDPARKNVRNVSEFKEMDAG